MPLVRAAGEEAAEAAAEAAEGVGEAEAAG